MRSLSLAIIVHLQMHLHTQPHSCVSPRPKTHARKPRRRQEGSSRGAEVPKGVMIGKFFFRLSSSSHLGALPSPLTLLPPRLAGSHRLRAHSLAPAPVVLRAGPPSHPSARHLVCILSRRRGNRPNGQRCGTESSIQKHVKRVRWRNEEMRDTG
ncbi:hypothetical protein DENSPDRAFT_717834 [Dentipellis sp. KUC8613]|nr:hypothetical protein DENSPDRAFT_717834 [Dentipellis sp. KUC8613]